MSYVKIARGIPVQQQKTTADERVREASKLYEKYFLDEMTKAMRSTISHSEEPSMAQNIYTEQLDKQYVEAWGDHGGVGLADVIYNQVQERFLHPAPISRPHSVIPLNPHTTIKIDNSKQMGIPIVSPKAKPQDEVSFLYEWEKIRNPEERDVENPFEGEVMQSFQTADQRQILKVAHDNGLVSTINFLGQGENLQPGDRVESGQKLGTLGAQARGLTWQLTQREV
jgi:Rod binding domain-containing protein